MKIWIYLVILTGLTLFLSMAGIEIGTGALKTFIGYNDSATNHTIQSVTISESPLGNYLFGGGNLTGLLILGISSVIFITAAIYTKDMNYLLAPFIIYVAYNWISVLAGVINFAVANDDSFITPLIILIFTPLTVGFIVSCVKWIRGTD